MRIMKKLAMVLSFALPLAAQEPKDPNLELAKEIAVEEQERDLAKAETMYRAAIGGGKLSGEAKLVAHLRLSRLLQRLGRDKEAADVFAQANKGAVATLDDVTPQGDPEREAALREKAAALVRQVVEGDQNHSEQSYPLPFVEQKVGEQLLWVGEPAVPVVVAELERSVNRSHNPENVAGLAGFLWRVGGPRAAQFFTEKIAHPEPTMRGNWVRTAWLASDPAMLAVAARYLRDPDDGVFRSLVSSGKNSLQRRFEPALLVDAALGGSTARQVWMLQWAAGDGRLDAATIERVVHLARTGLQSTDPALGTAARQFSLSVDSQSSTAGLELLLRELPKMSSVGSITIPPTPPWSQGERPRSRLTADEAKRLLPAIDECAKAIGPAPDSRSKRDWLKSWMFQVLWALDARIDTVATALAWADLGFGNVVGLLEGQVTSANARDVFARFDRLDPSLQNAVLGWLAKIDLPQDLFPALRDRADAVAATPHGWNTTPNWNELTAQRYLLPMARTGDPAAADWLAANAMKDKSVVRALVELGRLTKHERVRAAMRAAIDGAPDGSTGFAADTKESLVLALLAMHDTSALELVPRWSATSRAQRHPYATAAEPPQVTPLRYLVERDPDPPHGFSEDEVIGVLQKIAAKGIPPDWKPQSWTAGLIPDRVLGEIARLVALANSSSAGGYDWLEEIQARLRDRAERHEPLGPLDGWHAQMLATPAATMVLQTIDDANAAKLRPQIEKLVDSEDESIAFAATIAIARHFDVRTVDWAKHLIASRVREVRLKGLEMATALRGEDGEALALQMTGDPTDARGTAAEALGAMVSVKAVPRLVEMLRDPDSWVREKAAEALTRIRFYHEQQAHWDRVLKGLDASPASAAEKLLLQAKPDAPKAQRLLAIKSLGTLGVPEALPFLIDWANDNDAEIAAAANAAITTIHLNPRK